MGQLRLGTDATNGVWWVKNWWGLPCLPLLLRRPDLANIKVMEVGEGCGGWERKTRLSDTVKQIACIV